MPSNDMTSHENNGSGQQFLGSSTNSKNVWRKGGTQSKIASNHVNIDQLQNQMGFKGVRKNIKASTSRVKSKSQTRTKSKSKLVAWDANNKGKLLISPRQPQDRQSYLDELIEYEHKQQGFLLNKLQSVQQQNGNTSDSAFGKSSTQYQSIHQGGRARNFNVKTAFNKNLKIPDRALLANYDVNQPLKQKLSYNKMGDRRSSAPVDIKVFNNRKGDQARLVM